MDTLPPIPPEPAPFRRPADYYSSPADEVRPIFPRWVPFGCGTASFVLLLLLVGAAIGVSSGAFSSVFDMAFGSMQTDIDKMMTPDVKPPQKAAFDNEMKTMRASVRAGKLKIDRMQPLMRTMRDVVSDQRVTGPEVDRLTHELHTINTTP